MGKNITTELIRKSDMSDLRRDMYLDYVFQTTGSSCQWNDRKIALIAYFRDVVFVDKCLKYIMEVPKYIDVFITAASEEIRDLIEQKLKQKSGYNVIMDSTVNNCGKTGALLLAYKDILMKYEYLGFVYETGKNKDVVFQTINDSLCELMWENVIKNSIYIEHVIEAFEKEPLLGVLAPPLPYLSTFLKTGFCGWESYYEETLKLIKDLNLKCQVNRDKPPFILDIAFWCRTKALEPLFTCEIMHEDFVEEDVVGNIASHAIERVLPYVAQSQGYYSGIMMTAEYASLYICNYQYMLETLVNKGIHYEGCI